MNILKKCGIWCNQSCGCETKFRLRNSCMREEGHEPWPNDWILHHNNAPAHKALSLKQFLVQKSITEIERPPCYPDLAPNDFWLLPKIESAVKERRFHDIEDKKKKVTQN